MDEKELVLSIINKDENSYKILIKNYKSIVFNTCYSFLQSYEDAEEVSQDVFIEVFDSIHKFKFNSVLSTWIYRITVNKCIDTIRKKKSKKRLANLISIFSPEFSNSNQIVNRNTPETIYVNTENGNSLLKSIKKLPENQRTALVLSFMEGLSNKEISEVMDTTSSAVESLIQRAKKNLKKILDKAKE